MFIIEIVPGLSEKVFPTIITFLSKTGLLLIIPQTQHGNNSSSMDGSYHRHHHAQQPILRLTLSLLSYSSSHLEFIVSIMTYFPFNTNEHFISLMHGMMMLGFLLLANLSPSSSATSSFNDVRTTSSSAGNVSLPLKQSRALVRRIFLNLFR
jgi:hypothetical protein